MRIEHVQVKNFRALRNVEIQCRFLTSLVGPNGAGKSSFLHALDLFFRTPRTLSAQDFYSDDVGNPIELTVTFADLNLATQEELGAYVIDGRLSVTKTVTIEDGRIRESYHGRRPINPEFAEIRRLPAQEAIKRYAALIKTETYADLPPDTAKGRIENHLMEWEAQNPGACEITLDEGSYFGIDDKAKFNLASHIQFLLIPAVRDASTEVGGSGSVPGLLSTVANEALLENGALNELVQDVSLKIDGLVNPAEDPTLIGLQDGMNNVLRSFAPNARLDVAWEVEPPGHPRIRAAMGVTEDNYTTSVDRTGHGVQRAIIIAILQYQLARQHAAARDEQAPEPRMVLAIEEPELFQHPNRQRHFAEVLQRLAGGHGGVVEKTQVLIATHSPLFVNLDHFDCVRRLCKVTVDGLPDQTTVRQVGLPEIAKRLWEATGSRGTPFTPATLRARLQAVMTPWMNEGFFAQKVVLVEGESDRAVLLALARHLGRPLEKEGISVIPAGSKNNLDRPYLIFSALGIPTYLIWDADRPIEGKAPGGGTIATNRTLCTLVGTDPGDFPTGVHAHYAVHGENQEATLRRELGPERYRASLDAAKNRFGYSKDDDVLKSPAGAQAFIEIALESGGELPTLVDMLDHIEAQTTPVRSDLVAPLLE